MAGTADPSRLAVRPWWGRRPLTLSPVLAAGLLAAGVAVGAPAHAVPLPSCVGFDSTAQPSPTGVLACEVPAGISALTAVVTGAGGAGGSGARPSAGGNGAVVTTTLVVTPGETLTLQVGTGGTAAAANNPAGGGGGGWSAITRSGSGMVVAGGGGGGGSASPSTSVPAGTTYVGGDGGTPDGTTGVPAAVPGAPDPADPGGGATSTNPGAGGTGGAQTGFTGTFAAGGRGGDYCSGGGSRGGTQWQGGTYWTGCGSSTGGGGGSGLLGGGGGGAGAGGTKASGSGGGGSSYVAAGTATYGVAANGGASATAGGAGRVVLAAAPTSTVSAVAPTGGSTAGGTVVTVTGTHLRAGTTVTVGGQTCGPVVVASSTSLTCTTAAHAAGVVDVVVTGNGQSTLVGAYTYAVPLPGTPTGVTATAGTSSLTVSWTPPSSGGPVLRYEVRTAQGQAGCTTTTTSCVLGAQAGTSYDVTVEAVGVAGRTAATPTTSGPVSAPVVPPTVPGGAALTLTTDRGLITTVVPGQDVVLVGTGFAARSTVTIAVYSSPVVLGTVVTDGAGGFSRPVTVPVSLAAGAHTMVASGVDPQGVTHALRMEVTVAGPTAAGPPELAATGFSAGGLMTLGGLLTAVGAGLLLAGRRVRPRPAGQT